MVMIYFHCFWCLFSSRLIWSILTLQSNNLSRVVVFSLEPGRWRHCLLTSWSSKRRRGSRWLLLHQKRSIDFVGKRMWSGCSANSFYVLGRICERIIRDFLFQKSTKTRGMLHNIIYIATYHPSPPPLPSSYFLLLSLPWHNYYSYYLHHHLSISTTWFLLARVPRWRHTHRAVAGDLLLY